VPSEIGARGGEEGDGTEVHTGTAMILLSSISEALLEAFGKVRRVTAGINCQKIRDFFGSK
jgi:hypothetical protein